MVLDPGVSPLVARNWMAYVAVAPGALVDSVTVGVDTDVEAEAEAAVAVPTSEAATAAARATIFKAR